MSHSPVPTTAPVTDEGEATVALARPCLTCGGLIQPDGRCSTCGRRAPGLRDHYVEQPARWVAGSCDRGLRHARNEDAIALAADAEPGTRAVLVVCDGVSSAPHADLASLAAAQTAREVLTSVPAATTSTLPQRADHLARSIEQAAEQADRAVRATTDHGFGDQAADGPVGHNRAAVRAHTASCTFVAVVAEADLIVFGSVGDSRAYWLPDAPAPPQLLTTDDSLAQEQIAAGQAREVAENGPTGHAITRWLGADAPPLRPHLGWLRVPTAGWLLVCSDGLWNYATEPVALQQLVGALSQTATGPLALAEALVRWACDQGGKDNIAVAVARLSPVEPNFLPQVRR